MSSKYPYQGREPLFVADAPKQTVSLTINAELEKRRADILLAEIQADIAAMDDYIEKHGSFAASVRAHYADADDDPV